MRLELDAKRKEYDKTEDHMKAQQSIGQICGEVLQMLNPEKFIVKASSGPRFVVGVRSKIEKHLLKAGTRVALDMTTYTIMRVLPREVDPAVHSMQAEGNQERPTNRFRPWQRSVLRSWRPHEPNQRSARGTLRLPALTLCSLSFAL